MGRWHARAACVWACLASAAWAADPPDYLADVKPILQEHCWACHGALVEEAGLRLDALQLIQKGGDTSLAVVPGNPAESLLVQRITAAADSRMPPEGEGIPLSAEQVATLISWIEAGAIGPDREGVPPDPRDHWSFRPPERPPVPDTSGTTGANPIDGFIHREHQRHGLEALGPANKSVLLRRVYLDLVGLPPTREELHSFLADSSEHAYTQVVDRLLASPRYGERWARHWMDVWRYSDWYGRRMVPDVWNSAPQLWRWRDWIVRSLNGDKGYDQMVREMLAADEIVPHDPEAAVATGYLVRNWYALNPNEWMRHNVEHTAKAFLALTFNCAHCHNHKYDPILQEDYFRFRAFFEPLGIRQDRAPGESDPGPFQEYEYSVLRKIVRLGTISVFDKNPDAPTWFYTAGDERNRVEAAGSIEPGIPAVFGKLPVEVAPVDLPPVAWYPALRPEIQETLRAEAQAALDASSRDLAAATRAAGEALPPLAARAAEIEGQYASALAAAQNSSQPPALVGRQSLLLDATAGRRILHNGLKEIKSLGNGAVLRFQLLILSDSHFNFQLARDVTAGLTAGYVGFDRGRILAYQPGGFSEIEVGRYDHASGQNTFEVTLVLQTQADRCLLSVRCRPDGTLLTDNVPVALNGWNPVGNPAQAITFDARPGSVAVIDEVVVASPNAAGEGVSAQQQLAAFDFEPPAYADGQDPVGAEGWFAATQCQPPAYSMISTAAASPAMAELSRQRLLARQAVAAHELKIAAAQADVESSQAHIASIAACIEADRARFLTGTQVGAEAIDQRAREAGRLQRLAALSKAQAAELASRQLLAAAQAKGADDPQRPAEIQSATQQLAAAQTACQQAHSALADPAAQGVYAPLGPVYPPRGTGRRRALAEWIASGTNPLTARVAINHIWLRHFHAPLVPTVFDFGRNGGAPSHPELLDWLSVELMESGWSMKHVHRLIVTSQAYRRASSPAADAALAIDPENRFLWRMNAGRMQSEVVRDSLLHVAGVLDGRMGGQELENSEALSTRRRSLYYSCHPEVDGRSQFGALFDAPDPTECYRRTQSILPQQALALFNSGLVHDLSAVLAQKLAQNRSTGNPRSEQDLVTAAFEQVLARAPSAAELDACLTFLRAGDAPAPAAGVPAGPHSDAQVQGLIRALFNHNDFITIR